MKNLKLDTGVVSYKLGAGVLRFNPSDPNVYARFSQALQTLQQLEQALPEKLQQQDVLTVMADTDRAIKQELNAVFGPGNDFDHLLEGVNLLSAASDGRTVVQHLFETLEPVLMAGAKRCAGQQIQAAREKTAQRRQSQ